MERYHEFFATAKDKCNIADYILSMTFPKVKDPKLLFVALENSFLAITGAVQGVLQFEKYFKNIPPYPDTFTGRLEAFKGCFAKYKADNKIINEALALHDIIEKHRHSPMEFTREGKFVICNNTHDMTVLTVEDIKQHVSTAKSFVLSMSTQVEKYEGIYRRSIS